MFGFGGRDGGSGWRSVRAGAMASGWTQRDGGRAGASEPKTERRKKVSRRSERAEGGTEKESFAQERVSRRRNERLSENLFHEENRAEPHRCEFEDDGDEEAEQGAHPSADRVRRGLAGD